jgi:L-xylulokinase
MAEFLLGIDNGCTVSKAAIFDLEGREMQVAGQAIDLDCPHPGWTERSMDGVWRTTSQAIREAIERAGINARDIVGIGTTGHGNGVYLLDRAGQPLRAGIVSTDTRAADIVTDWYRNGRHDQAFPRTMQSFWPAQPNALLAWIKQHEPENYRRIGSVLLIKDYVKYCLTGVASGDFSDTSASSLLDSARGEYSRDLLELYDIPEILAALPPLAQSFDVVGKVTPAAAQATGLAAGTPVVGGLIDIEASALGTGVFRPGQASIVCGSWSINQIVTSQPLAAPHIFMTIPYTVPGLWLTVEASATSASNLEWFVKHFCAEERAEAQKRGISVYEVCNELVDSLPPGGTSVIFHPFLFGSNVQATARAGFYGVAGWHNKAHLLRALYEGVVYGHLSHIEKLQGIGAHIEMVRLSGGGSRSRVWTQIFADTLRLPVEVADGSEMGARGAAISAGIGVGAYRDHADATARAVRIVRRQEPGPQATPHYLARYAEYRRLLEAMQTPWEHLSKLQ